MRYTLVTFLACPACSGELAVIVVQERPAPAPVRARVLSDCVAAEGAIVAPLTSSSQPGVVRSILERHAAPPAPSARDYQVEVETGLLVCQACARWFPIIGCLPELLPDHLRDRERDARFFEDCSTVLPPEFIDAISAARPASPTPDDDRGAPYKRAEIAIESKVDDPSFFAPGYSSPFNPHNTDFTLYLIKLFGAAVPLLELKIGDVLLDSGCGYSWTTEWLYKAGVEALGVDICRSYLEIGIQRMGPDRPHLIVADVENLPIRSAVLDAILAFESAHHIPDRKRAMAGFSRALKPAGRMVLAEPGAEHEHAKVAVDVMNKYGILEKGMELDDIHDYADGTDMGAAEQIFLVRASQLDLGRTVDRAFVKTRSAIEGNLFRLTRRAGAREAVRSAWHDPRRVVWPKMKRRMKAALIRLGLE